MLYWLDWKSKRQKASPSINPSLKGVPGFDETYYLSQNPDVAAAVAAGAFTSGLEHFNKHGAKELRDPNPYFDTKYYLTQNPDVAAAISDGLLTSAFAHYQQAGGIEGRKPSEDFVGSAEFDYKQYLSANPDLVAAGFTTPELAYTHYIRAGVLENRTAKSITGQDLIDGVPKAEDAIVFDGGGSDGSIATFTINEQVNSPNIIITFSGGATGQIALSSNIAPYNIITQNYDYDLAFSRNGLSSSKSFSGPDTAIQIQLDTSSSEFTASGFGSSGASPAKGVTIRGSIVSDRIVGSSYEDTIDGLDGNDDISGGNANDSITGGAGADLIRGEGGNDIIYGNQGNDSIFGGEGNDTVQSGQGDDLIEGGDGDDNLDGGSTGNDNINGGLGNDTITGGTGDDAITPGSGINILQFADFLASSTTAGTVTGVYASTGTDEIAAFNVANDQFQLDISVFGNTVGTAGGTLAAAQFDDVAGTTDAITAMDVGTGAVGIVFDTFNSDLYFIQAGAVFTSGASSIATLLTAGDAFKIAHITSISGSLTASDFNIVM